MLNRNRLFGKPDEKADEKVNKGLGMGAYPPSSGSQGQRPRISQEAPLPAAGHQPPAPVRESPPASVESSQSLQESRGSKLIVGPNIKLKGVEITDCDTLVVEGHVEATMDSRTIQIAEPGTFQGTVGIDVAEIYGTFSGELTARKRLVIHSSGKVTGKIRYGKLIIEEGGELTGELTALGAAPQVDNSKPVSRSPATGQ